MKRSSLQLNEFFITKMNVEWKYVLENPKLPDRQNYNVGLDYNVAQHNERKEHFRLEFKVKLTPIDNESGYLLESTIIGFFSFNNETSDDEMQLLIRVNGCSMLYSLLRGQVAMVTGSFPSGKFNLPTVVISDWIERIENSKKKPMDE
jgi:preprotein translocase subunit SecB